MPPKFVLGTFVTAVALVLAGPAAAASLGASGAAEPATVSPGGSTLLKVTVTPSDSPPSTGIGVACNTSPIGGFEILLYDDGTHGDATAGDLTFSRLVTVAPDTPLGPKSIACVVNDAQSQTAFATIPLNVVAPQPPSNLPPTASAGGPYSVDEGGQVPLSATGSDPEGGPLTYAWDLDGNGTFETAGQTVSFSAANLDGPSTHVVTVQVTDNAGATATAQATVNVQNVAPTATFNAPSSVVLSTPFTLSLTNPSDPSTADQAAGFTYAFDCGSGYAAFSASNSIVCPGGDIGSLGVGGKIRDKDGGVTEYRSTVSVNVTFSGLCALTTAYSTKPGVAHALCAKLENAAVAPTPNARNGLLGAYENQVDAQTGKAFTAAQAAVLKGLADRLRS